MKVLQSVAAPGTTIKYIDQVVRFAPSSVEFSYFSWFSALFGRWDVFHVHWPEFLVRSKYAPLRWWRMALLRLFITRMRLAPRPIVRTVHNLEPHEKGSSAEARLLGRLDELTTWRVTLNPCSPGESSIPQTVILHGDYKEQFEGFERSEAVPGRVTFFGRIEPYKGVLELVDLFELAADPGDSLRIVGRPSADMADQLKRRRAAWSREEVTLELIFDYVSDERMIDEITSAEVVILPYREMHNSGVALVSLSLARPIVVPAGCVNEALAREVGEEWVVQYPGELTVGSLRDALRRARAGRCGTPNLRQRDWKTVASAYAEVYRQARGVINEVRKGKP